MSIRLALGVPGAGKSLALQDMVRDGSREGHVYFVPDRAAEWSATELDGVTPNVRWRGDPPNIVYAPPPQHEKEVIDLDWYKEIRDTGNAVVLFPYPWEARDVARIAQQVGGVVYCDDEIDLLATYQAWLDNPVRDFVHRGRHLPDVDGIPREVHIYGAARRPQNLHTDVTSMADEVLIFRVAGSRTLKRLVDEGMLTEEMVPEARTMPNFHYFLWKSTGEITRGVLEGLT